MNIAMFTNTYLPLVGGIENSVATFVEDFKKAGHRCLVVTPEMDGAEDSTREILRIPAVKHFGGTSFSWHLPIPGIIGPALDDFQPDIVHSHHPFLLGDAALRSARKRGIPLLLTYHTIWERYSDFFPTETIKNIVIKLTVEYSNVCDHVVAPSESIRQFLLNEMGVENDISVIPTGIDTGAFASGDRAKARALMNLGPDDRVIGYVGRIGPEKNLAYLCDAAVHWCRADPKARLVIVGCGDYSATLEGIFEAAGIRDRLVLAGVRRGRDLADAYAALDCFAFASHTETQGIVLAEAMAAGLPIIALDAPGSREATTDEWNGRLLPGDSTPEQYGAALQEFFSNEARLREWSQHSRERSAEYHRSHTAERMLALYHELIERQQGEWATEGGFTRLDSLMGRLEAEWDLISTKASATMAGVAAKIASRESAGI